MYKRQNLHHLFLVYMSLAILSFENLSCSIRHLRKIKKNKEKIYLEDCNIELESCEFNYA